MPKRIPLCAVFGGGGHARVVIDALLASGAGKPVAVLEADPKRWGTDLLGVEVVGHDDAALPKGVTHFVVGLGGVKDNGPRAKVFAHALGRGLKPLTVVHPRAVVSPFAKLGEGTVVLALAVVNAAAELGKNVIVNSGAIVEHDCRVGDHVHVATGAKLASGVTIGEFAHVGAGAVVRQGATLGPKSVIGAGAAVVGDVPAGATFAGVPAKELKR